MSLSYCDGAGLRANALSYCDGAGLRANATELL